MLRRVLMVLLFAPTLVAAALLTGGGPRAAQRAAAPLLSEKPPQDVDLPTKAVWFATEALTVTLASLVLPLPMDATIVGVVSTLIFTGTMNPRSYPQRACTLKYPKPKSRV